MWQNAWFTASWWKNVYLFCKIVFSYLINKRHCKHQQLCIHAILLIQDLHDVWPWFSICATNDMQGVVQNKANFKQNIFRYNMYTDKNQIQPICSSWDVKNGSEASLYKNKTNISWLQWESWSYELLKCASRKQQKWLSSIKKRSNSILQSWPTPSSHQLRILLVFL